MEKCSVPDCENEAVEEGGQCAECQETSEKLAKVFREKTEEVVIDGEIYV